VGGIDGRSRNAVPLRVIPDTGQVADQTAEPSNRESWAVLHKEEPGSKDANGFGDLSP